MTIGYGLVKTAITFPRVKRFLSEVKQGITPLTVWLHEDVGHTQSATQGLNKIGELNFPNPKPHTLY